MAGGDTIVLVVTRTSGSGTSFTGTATASAGDLTNPGSPTTQLALPHTSLGTVSNVGTGGTSVTFPAEAAFTSSSTYACTAVNLDSTVAVRVQRNSGSQITLFIASATDDVRYSCLGN